MLGKRLRRQAMFPKKRSRKEGITERLRQEDYLAGDSIHAKSSFNEYMETRQNTRAEHFWRAVANEKFWHASEVTQLQRVPRRFKSVEEYIKVFEPLLLKECQAQLHSTWEELTKTLFSRSIYNGQHSVCGKGGRSTFVSSGWYRVTVICEDRCNWTFREGDIAVLSFGNPGYGCQAAISKRTHTDASVASELVTGMLWRDRYTEGPPRAILYFYDGHTFDPNSKVEYLFLQKFRLAGSWYLTPLGSLITAEREYVSLHAFGRLSRQMRQVILNPSIEKFPNYDESPSMPQCFSAKFVNHLQNSFNGPQLSAIQQVAMHTAVGSRSMMSKRHDSWPFTLVQGPPGTGKTHTIWGMLNAIYHVQYQHYYTTFLKKLAIDRNIEKRDCSSENFNTGSTEEAPRRKAHNLFHILPEICLKPRMLVCAPSNAATDELLVRVLDRGFVDLQMNVYRPAVARVGIGCTSGLVQAVSVEHRTELLLAKDREEIFSWMGELKDLKSQLRKQRSCLQKELDIAAAEGFHEGLDADEPDSLICRDHNHDRLLKKLAMVLMEQDKVRTQVSRLLIVQRKFLFPENFKLEIARAKLQASFANEAEIVFTTVSSSGRKLLHGFDFVVIDEAAQASEVAVLPPLSTGASHSVLVGDPKQLPATVISREAETLLYGRSLFERLQQAGCPAMSLSVQYRMHPEIRNFPSRYFYQGRLTDSETVVNLPDEIYYKSSLMRPYVFYDIAHGRESQGDGFVSYENIHEANFCFHIYEHLQKTVKSLGIPKVSVGIITPYKRQLNCLRRKFGKVLHTKEGKDLLYINTVDAFQGQERDVIIMSCVRASRRGLGFVADVRRMKVAITRAKRALWIMGNADALMQSKDWAALIADAKSRNCYLDMESLFKELLDAQGNT